MRKEAYGRLIDSLNVRRGAIVALHCPELYELLEELFTPEEAELISQIPPGFSPVERIAQEAGKSTAEVVLSVEKLTDKGLMLSLERGGTKLYSPLPLLPGIFEFQFMKGEISQRTKKLARLFEDYFEAIRKAPPAVKASSIPFARVIPVEKEIKAKTEVFPYEQASEYINNAESISVSTCYCRHHGELLGNPCDKPKDVCLSIGPSAKFIAEKGFGHLISKEEAMQILDRCEEAGLVHCSSNTSKYIDFICNCCGCHCGILQSIKDTRMPSLGVTSNFIVEVDKESCTGCEACIYRCQMEALSMKDNVVERDLLSCIGCGLCISSCPSEALKMAPRAERHTPPRDHRELMASREKRE